MVAFVSVVSLEARAGVTVLDFNFLNDVNGHPIPSGGLNLHTASASFQAHNSVNSNETINVSAFNNSANNPGPKLAAPNLYIKNQGGDESGLGVDNDPVNNEHELTPYSTINFNVNHLETVFGITSIEFKVGSAQNGHSLQNEGFSLSGAKGNGTETSLATVTSPGVGVGDFVAGYSSGDLQIKYVANGQYSLLLSGANISNYDNFSFTAAGQGNKGANGHTGFEFPNILLNTLTATGNDIVISTPEPSTLVTASLGLIFGAGTLIRRRKARLAA